MKMFTELTSSYKVVDLSYHSIYAFSMLLIVRLFLQWLVLLWMVKNVQSQMEKRRRNSQ